MKRWLDRLTPTSLRRLDTWLLTHHPVLWRSRGHYVLFYALLAAAGFFLAGLLMPLNLQDLPLPPVGRYDVADRSAFILPMLGVLLALAYWGYLQYQYRGERPGLRGNLGTLGILMVGSLVLMSLVPQALPTGQLVQTAYFTMDQADLETVESHDFYVYGLAFPQEHDPAQVVTIQSHERLAEAEARFRQLVRNEGWLQQQNYLDDSRRGEYYYGIRHLAEDAWEMQGWEQHSYRDYDPFDLYEFQREDLVYLPGLVDTTYRHYMDPEPWQIRYGTATQGGYARLAPSPEKDYSDYTHRNGNSYYGQAAVLQNYDIHYWQTQTQPSRELLDRYGLVYRVDTFQLYGATLHLPRHVFELEALTRSVLHARMVVESNALVQHWRYLLAIALALGVLGLGLPYLRLRPLFGAAVGMGVLFLGYMFVWHEVLDIEHHYDDAGAWGPLLLTQLLAWGSLLMARLKRRQRPVHTWVFHLHLLSFLAALPVWAENEFALNGLLFLFLAMAVVTGLSFPWVERLPQRR